MKEEIGKSKDPCVKREEKRLLDLLASCKSLRERLEPSQATPSHLSEIYAILHPELYQNIREKEKERLADLFANTSVINISHTDNTWLVIFILCVDKIQFYIHEV